MNWSLVAVCILAFVLAFMTVEIVNSAYPDTELSD